MHLALICNEYPPAPHGGIGSFSQDLAEGMVVAGHRVTVVGIYAGQAKAESQSINGVTVVRLPFSKIPGYRPAQLWNRYRLKKWLAAAHAREHFDVLEVPDYEGWLTSSVATDLPVVACLHGSNFFFDTELQRAGNPFEHALEKKTVARAGFLRGFSRYAFDRTLQHCGLVGRTGLVLYHAVDTTQFSPGPEKVEPGLIVFVNTVNAKKGTEQLIEAASLIFPTHANARLLFIGGSKPGYTDKLLERVPALLRDRIQFAGRLERSAIIPWLRQANVCCYPSHMETFGLAPVEAMSVGRPTIYSRMGPGPEIIEDGISGLLCDPGNPHDIADKISRVLTQPELASKLGDAARHRVLERFDKTKWIPANVQYYTDCIAEFKNSHAA